MLPCGARTERGVDNLVNNLTHAAVDSRLCGHRRGVTFYDLLILSRSRKKYIKL